MAAFTAALLALPQEGKEVENVRREDEGAEEEGRQGGEQAEATPLQPEGWADYFDLPTFPDNDGLTGQERNELRELEEWRRMQEEARTEQRRKLELLRRQRAPEQLFPRPCLVLG